MSDDSPILESEARHQALPAGYRLGEYEIERILGEGGFGVTYLARHTVILKRVAIKEYLPVDFAVRSEGQTVRPRTESTREHYEWGLERFLEEARTLAKLDHPHLLKVSDFLRANDTAYIVMEYVEGESLEAVVGREGRLDAAWVQEMMWVLINALWHVHQEKILHRDIKPENIQIRPDGSPVLIDFGAAREELGRRSRSMTAIVAAGYSPLEQYSELGTRTGFGPTSTRSPRRSIESSAAAGPRRRRNGRSTIKWCRRPRLAPGSIPTGCCVASIGP